MKIEFLDGTDAGWCDKDHDEDGVEWRRCQNVNGHVRSDKCSVVNIECKRVNKEMDEEKVGEDRREPCGRAKRQKRTRFCNTPSHHGTRLAIPFDQYRNSNYVKVKMTKEGTSIELDGKVEDVRKLMKEWL